MIKLKKHKWWLLYTDCVCVIIPTLSIKSYVNNDNYINTKYLFTTFIDLDIQSKYDIECDNNVSEQLWRLIDTAILILDVTMMYVRNLSDWYYLQIWYWMWWWCRWETFSIDRYSLQIWYWMWWWCRSGTWKTHYWVLHSGTRPPSCLKLTLALD